MKNFIVMPMAELIKDKTHEELRPLEERLGSFICQKEHDLEYFLSRKAIEYENTGYGKTFLLLDSNEIEKKNFRIMAFFTIAQTSLDITALSKKKRKKVIGSSIPGRDKLDSIPAYLIGQIGRDDRYFHKDLPGHVILEECYTKIDDARKIIGGSLLLLECRPKMFENFYEAEKFSKLNIELGGHREKDTLLTLYKKFS